MRADLAMPRAALAAVLLLLLCNAVSVASAPRATDAAAMPALTMDLSPACRVWDGDALVVSAECPPGRSSYYYFTPEAVPKAERRVLFNRVLNAHLFGFIHDPLEQAGFRGVTPRDLGRHRREFAKLLYRLHGSFDGLEGENIALGMLASGELGEYGFDLFARVLGRESKNCETGRSYQALYVEDLVHHQPERWKKIFINFGRCEEDEDIVAVAAIGLARGGDRRMADELIERLRVRAAARGSAAAARCVDETRALLDDLPLVKAELTREIQFVVFCDWGGP